MRKALLLSTLILSAVQAHATITVNSITGAAKYEIKGNTTAATTPGGSSTPAAGTATVNIWGGLAGWDAGGNPSCAVVEMDTVNPCNSCPSADCKDPNGNSQTPLCACNRGRIYSDLLVGLSVSQSENPKHKVGVATTISGTPSDVTANMSFDGVSFRWGEVCKAITGSMDDCEQVTQSSSSTFYLYIDKNDDGKYQQGEEKIDVTLYVVNPDKTSYNVYGAPGGAADGIGDFTPWPGDDRIYIKDANTTPGFPNLGYTTKATSVKIFLSKTSLAEANASQRDIEGSVELDSTGALNQNFVGDVENGVPYFMRIALEDQAGNIVQYFPDLVGTDVNAQAHPACFTGAIDVTQCPFAVIPDQVLGILTKDFNCFIASAAYGTTLEPKLNLFRRFRNDVLLPKLWGRGLVWKYYAYGPYAARYISDKPILRAMVRGLLWPVAGYAWLALQIGLAKSLMVSLALLSLLVMAPLLTMRRFSRRA